MIIINKSLRKCIEILKYVIIVTVMTKRKEYAGYINLPYITGTSNTLYEKHNQKDKIEEGKQNNIVYIGESKR